MGRLVRHISPGRLALMVEDKLKSSTSPSGSLRQRGEENRGDREDPNVDIKPSHSSIIVNQHERD